MEGSRRKEIELWLSILCLHHSFQQQRGKNIFPEGRPFKKSNGGGCFLVSFFFFNLEVWPVIWDEVDDLQNRWKAPN